MIPTMELKVTSEAHHRPIVKARSYDLPAPPSGTCSREMIKTTADQFPVCPDQTGTLEGCSIERSRRINREVLPLSISFPRSSVKAAKAVSIP